MATSIRDRFQGLGNRTGSVNVGKMERWASVLGGAALAAYALKRRNRGRGSLGLAALGAPLLWRGATGHCAVYQRLGIDRMADQQGTGMLGTQSSLGTLGNTSTLGSQSSLGGQSSFGSTVTGDPFENKDRSNPLIEVQGGNSDRQPLP